MGKESSYKRRCSKLTPSAFIKALLSTSLCPYFNLEVFGSFLNKQKVSITKQGIHERFNKQTETFVKVLSTSFLNYFKTEKLPKLGQLEIFTSLNIIDSSSISLHSSLSQLFKGSGGAASGAALKIQLMFDYLIGQIKELTVTSGCDNDQGFDDYFHSIEAGALYLMDLGYFKLNSFKKIREGHAFFVSRLLIGTKLFTLEKHPLDLLATLSTAESSFSQQVLMGAKAQIPVRLITQKLPKEIADRRRQRLKEDHRRRGTKLSKEALALQDWSLYITNTCETQISKEQIHQIYTLRWQIELLFKLSKSLMHIDSMRTTKSSRVIIEIYGKFMAMMLLFLLCEPVRNQCLNQFSFYKACKLLSIHSAGLIASFASKYRLKQFITFFYGELVLFAKKDIKKKHNVSIKTPLLKSNFNA